MVRSDKRVKVQHLVWYNTILALPRAPSNGIPSTSFGLPLFMWPDLSDGRDITIASKAGMPWGFELRSDLLRDLGVMLERDARVARVGCITKMHDPTHKKSFYFSRAAGQSLSVMAEV